MTGSSLPSIDDSWSRLGVFSPDRILLDPAPGTAAEDDMVAIRERGGWLFELLGGGGVA